MLKRIEESWPFLLTCFGGTLGMLILVFGLFALYESRRPDSPFRQRDAPPIEKPKTIYALLHGEKSEGVLNEM
jgi:hypothetical protein